MKTLSALALGLFLPLFAGSALADQGHESHAAPGAKSTAGETGHGHMGREGMKMDAPVSPHAPGMREMHEQMRAIREHSRMMDGITDPEQLSEEMKKHKRMMDEMMEKIVEEQMKAMSAGEPRS